MLTFGWDVSSSCIGACCLDEYGQVVLIEPIRLWDIEEGLTAKYRVASAGIVDFIIRARARSQSTLDGSERHFIEERLMNMQGRTTRQVIVTLASMNAVATHVIIEACHGDHKRVVHLHPSRVKSLVGLRVPKGSDKKEAAVAFARARCPQFPYVLNRGGVNPVKGTDDMADAYITALAGMSLDPHTGEKVIAAQEGPRRSRDRAVG